MSVINIIIIVSVVLLFFGLTAFGILKWVPKRLKTEKYARKWKELQVFCRERKTWPQALSQADRLLDTALKQRKFKGKTMGERMVSAQRVITNNDSMWFAHNLTKKLIENPASRPKESDIKSALIGYRNALKDLGAIRAEPKSEPDEHSEVKK